MDKPDQATAYSGTGPVPNPVKFFPFQSVDAEGSVPDHSGDTPGVAASLTDGDWNADSRPAPAAGNWNNPGSINSGLTEQDVEFAKGSGAKY